MLIETKAKVKYLIGNKPRIRTETFILDLQFFAEAEYKVTEVLSRQQEEGTVLEFEIQTLRIASVREVVLRWQGEKPFITAFRDIFVDDNGNEKKLRYKILLWADSLQQAYTRAEEIARQGYDMHVESLKETDIIYLEADSAEPDSPNQS